MKRPIKWAVQIDQIIMFRRKDKVEIINQAGDLQYAEDLFKEPAVPMLKLTNAQNAVEATGIINTHLGRDAKISSII